MAKLARPPIHPGPRASSSDQTSMPIATWAVYSAGPGPQPGSHIPEAPGECTIDQPMHWRGSFGPPTRQHESKPNFLILGYGFPEDVERHVDEGHIHTEAEY